MKKKIWIINIIALTGFLLTFRPQITGYSFHEWLGLAVGLTLLIHLVQHWRWVESICRTLKCVKTRLLIRFIVDGLMGAGLITIIVTGLIMSSILNLELNHYEAWRSVHFTVSYFTLVLLVAKITLHWRLINNMIAKSFNRNQKQRIMTPEQVSRRNFLKDAGVVTVGLLGMVAAGVGVNLLVKNVRAASAYVESQASTQAELETTVDPTATTAGTQLATTDSTSNGITPIQPMATYTVIPTATPTPIIQTGRALCNKHCAYPGRCRLYVDNNQNGLCDRGEYIW